MKVGDKAVVIYSDRRINPVYVHITRIGHKYITVDNMHPSQARFDIKTLMSIDDSSGYNINAKLYSSIEAYNEELEDKQLRKALYDDILSLLRNVSIKSLITIKNYLNDKAD